jgi:hypothetical protein
MSISHGACALSEEGKGKTLRNEELRIWNGGCLGVIKKHITHCSRNITILQKSPIIHTWLSSFMGGNNEVKNIAEIKCLLTSYNLNSWFFSKSINSPNLYISKVWIALRSWKCWCWNSQSHFAAAAILRHHFKKCKNFEQWIFCIR